jgi:hypothetical protein
MAFSIFRAAEKLIHRSLVAGILLCWCAASHGQAVPADQDATEQPAAIPTYVYWTNYQNGTIGRASTTGTGANEAFIGTITGGSLGGAGITVDSKYVYWTGANGGSATTIARANLNGTSPNKTFITGAHNPCGVAVNKTNIYWAGDVGSAIGRANLDGTGVNQNFISTGTGVCGVAVTGTHIYWANYRSGEIGRANLNGTSVDTSFIGGSGAGIAIYGGYIYYTSSTGTAIGRAKINGTGVNPTFISGLNGEIAFLAVNSKGIFWADWGANGNGTTIGHASLTGTGVNQSFIKGAKGPFGIAVTGGDP